MNTSTVIYIGHALTPSKRDVQSFVCCSLAELDPNWNRPYIALVDGKAVLRKYWNVPLIGVRSVVFIDARAFPQGGGGSNPLRIIATLAVIAVAAFTQQHWAYGGLLGMSAATTANVAAGLVMMAGMALVNVLLPPTLPSNSAPNSAASASPTYSLQAQGNYARLEQAIPEHFGRHIAYPDFAAQPYSEAHGNEVYLYQLLCIGRGEYEIESIRIEDTSIDNFEDINYEIVGPGIGLSLFPANVETSGEVSGQDMPEYEYVGPFAANSEGTDAYQLGVDFLCPRGLYYAEDDGSLDHMNIRADIEYREIDMNGAPLGDWVLAKSILYREKTYTPLRFTEKWDVPPGRYEVRVKRTNDEKKKTRVGHDVQWVGLRGYLKETRTYGDTTMIAMVMRASDQLSSQSSRQVNVICTRKLPVWNGSTWSALQPTRSIAWAAAYCCKEIGLVDAQIDLAALLYLDGIWTARGDRCDGRLDSFTSFWEALSQIVSCGRCKPFQQGGMIRFWRDQADTLPVAHFSMLNIVKGSLSIDYLMPTEDTADAVDAWYFDELAWKRLRVRGAMPDSIAEKPVKLETSFITNRDNAYKHAVYMAACNRLRRKVIKFQTELEGFIPSLGDTISIQHDMPAWGQAGEIVAYDSETRTALTSEPLEWQDGQPHYITLRGKDGSFHGPIPVIKGGSGSFGGAVILGTDPGFDIYTGDHYERTHYSFGWAETWGQLAKVLSVKPKGAYLVEIEAINEDPAVHTAEEGLITPPPQTSQLSNYTDAPKVEELTATSMPGDSNQVILAWKPAPWADRYLIEASTGGAYFTKLGESTTPNFTARAIYGPDTIFAVAAVGATIGQRATVAYSEIVVSAWAQDVSSFRALANKAMVELAWTVAVGWNVTGYEIRVGDEWETGSVIVTGLQASSFTWQPTEDGLLKFHLKAIDNHGIYSAETATVHLSINEPVVSSLSQQTIDNNVLLSWTATPGTYAIAHAEVRRGLDFATAEVVGRIDGTFTAIFETEAGSYKYWVVLVDAAGLYGQEVGVYASVNQPPDYVLHDSRALSWSGTIDSLKVEPDGVYAPVDITETYQEHFVDRAWATPQEQINGGYPLFIQPTEATGQYAEVIDYGTVVPSTKITLTVSRTAITGTVAVTPTLSVSADGVAWTDHVGVYEVYATNFRYAKITLAFSTSDSGLLRINEATVKLDVKQKTIQGTVAAVSTDSGGTLVDITGKFIDVQSILLTPSGTVAAIAVYDFVDAPNPTSFRVYLFNTSGTRISGPVSYTIRGV